MSKRKNNTLREGLEAFYENYQESLNHLDKGLPKEVRDFFRSHDVAHVIFGCDISLFGEGTVKLWTVFGTTLGFWKHLSEYRKANAFELSKKFSPTVAIRDFFKLFIMIPSLILRAKRMHRPWPWKDFEEYLDLPITEIREEFNIKVLK
ncbi:hypothetical protein [Spongiimicrobium salis]|uniref:hypothetical protein n=1 Tax=Spongiimicrobium salis TaxID=1667022 RepID=UPI00374D0C08